MLKEARTVYWVKSHAQCETCSVEVHLYPEHSFGAEYLEFFFSIGVVVPLVALEGRLFLRQSAGFLVQAGVDDVCAFLSGTKWGDVGSGEVTGGVGGGGGCEGKGGCE